MRVFAISDLHLDYAANYRWLQAQSIDDYKSDILILAGDVADDLALLDWAFGQLTRRFREVFFVPGNHELWVRNSEHSCSLEKFHAVNALCDEVGVCRRTVQIDDLLFVPLLSWYDYSFATPDTVLKRAWRDYRACSWPGELTDSAAVNNYFLNQNLPLPRLNGQTVISFSHFLPRLDLMPRQIPVAKRRVYPVLGSEALGRQVAILKPKVHVYGHSHVNRELSLDDTRFVNNAFGNPRETRITRKKFFCIYDDGAVSPQASRISGLVC